MKSTVTILVTNDDGIDAPGLKALVREFKLMEEVEVWVCAPCMERSACSHQITLSRPVFADEISNKTFSVDGKPADCVYLALFGLMNALPDVVVSGINKGPNLGCDVVYSGTVAGAREAALRGVHGIAFSLTEGNDFSYAAKNAALLALKIAKSNLKAPVLLNVNYPKDEFEGPKPAPLGKRRYPCTVEKRISQLHNKPYYWLGGPPISDECIPETDGWLINKNIASATLLLLDQTDTGCMKNFKNIDQFTSGAIKCNSYITLKKK